MNYTLVNYRVVRHREGESTIAKIYSYEFITDPHDLPEWHSKNKMNSHQYQHYQPHNTHDKEYYTLLDWNKWNDISHSDNWLWKALVTNVKPLVRKRFIEDILIQ